ncbi:CAP domain-containing protein [Pukyongiella litopenaei]|uniref:CAP domain-containing protein n=1 Tax=Pukyongiella litopenaei TaxID=2605946 RepID=A0A2S0MU83_9RHOB|nr:CAP domain-containing protein [Pukyongiella litopenaei]AVO39357.1 CAP domain-containing protein [Pukyongiella litopenaei]
MRQLLHWIAATLFLASPVAANPAAIEALNAYRSAKGRAPVAYSRQLEAAALRHARDMARNSFVSHRGSDGSFISHRARAQGYRFCYLAENLAQGQADLDAVMSDWAGSAEHRKNMLSRKATEFALVRVDGNYWVMMLGRPGCR